MSAFEEIALVCAMALVSSFTLRRVANHYYHRGWWECRDKHAPVLRPPLAGTGKERK